MYVFYRNVLFTSSLLRRTPTPTWNIPQWAVSFITTTPLFKRLSPPDVRSGVATCSEGHLFPSPLGGQLLLFKPWETPYCFESSCTPCLYFLSREHEFNRDGNFWINALFSSFLLTFSLSCPLVLHSRRAPRLQISTH